MNERSELGERKVYANCLYERTVTKRHLSFTAEGWFSPMGKPDQPGHLRSPVPELAPIQVRETGFGRLVNADQTRG